MRKLIVLLALTLAATAGTVPLTDGAQAMEADTLVANITPTWQTNGTVWSLAYANGVVYASGDFTSVRPPGAALGTNEVPRNRLAAFSASTGALLPFNHSLDAKAWVMTPSADGSTLYIGGDFTHVDGKYRAKLAAFDTATGSLTTWAPKASGPVRGLAVSGTTVYVGGSFNFVNSTVARKNLAAFTTAGALLPWAPTANLTVFRIKVAPNGSRVFVGGYFTTLNGVAMRGTGALDPTTGATLPWASANVLPPHTSTCSSDIKDMRVDANNVYFAAEGTGGGCFDGTFAARQSDGALLWKNTCLGATQAIELVGNWLYKGSHAHNCSSAGSFPEVGTGHARHLLVERPSDGSIGPWWPNTNGNPLGPRAFATDGAQLFVGGDFGTVNSKAQQGFTRFGGPPDLARPRRPNLPIASSTTAGQVRLFWQATTDDDDETLIYRVYRDGASTPLFTSAPTRSTFWILPMLSFTETGLTGGSSHTYRVDAKEANGPNVSSKSAAVTVTVASTDANYPTTVKGDLPYLYWRLGEASGATTAADSSGNGRTGLYQGSIAYSQAGAISGDSNTAVRLGGVSPSDGYVTTQSTTTVKNPQTFSLELWFKTTSTTGGKLIGFGSSRTGNSAQYDRHVYMTNDGRLVFGTWTGSATVITTTGKYNNGAYHHVVATLGSAGMALYVDGALVGTNPNTVAQAYNGFWRVGGDNLSHWPNRPTSNYFKGTVDEAAVYTMALSASQVAEHFDHAH